ncbi:beta-galactosidase [Bifidobacterium adolescentis]|uniref:beta-galactosidase n=1 Tax=Bifidobacterium adolescentis TaxID=1680 RepID=UPI00068F3E46|nr:beta-galactosidase [Bifidobacterium adolescentis]MDB0582876.1 beta-galactosidase [Bifidobacterium adolescentis]MDB0597846.1 beta-galactosidase [Bifidobacterium adolescentis]MDB0606801.1 beta-galactosidase [Bifidobacterium adolescentis]MDB0609989.1 beta-galactosidase [Bifidobacterium adolescentis]MDB0625251.1 beta-galactosidase [Bifidobacterium adolescentis]
MHTSKPAVPTAAATLTATPNRQPFAWPKLLTENGRGIAFGGDYNPDQWSEETWDDDVCLMKKAGVNTVALAIFSWDRIQPQENRWDFGWLDRIIDKLGKAGIATDLASATATAPLWLYEKHPEVLPCDKFGHPVNAGSRQSWSPTSPVFKEYALTLCRKLAERYGANPYVTAWHMGNEYGWNNRNDYSDNALNAFRLWCERKYGTIGALNQAWGTTFWGQEMNSFDEVLIPRFMGADSMVNPGQKLDFERFGNDMLLDFYKAERDAIAEICPDKPFTTNFMVSTDQCCMDYADWANEVNFVSNDHYFHEGGEMHLDELACSDALMDSFALGKPWYVMEHSTSAVQWKPLNMRKRKGETVRDSLAHVAMGADAINFFQWRASAFGAESFHSAMVPHAGEDTKLFRQVCELGETLQTLADAGVQGSELERSDTAILFSAESEWATRSQTLPSMKLNHWHDVRDWYRAFLNAGSRADIMPLKYDWSDYKTVVLPTVLMLSAVDTRRLADFAAAGGRVVVGYATGLIDENFHTWLGGYPGAGNGLLRDMLGIRGEEFNILGSGVEGEPEAIRLGAGGEVAPEDAAALNGATTRLWQNDVTVTGDRTQVLAMYAGEEADEWELDGMAAVTRNPYGAGEAYFVGCDLDVADLTKLIRTYLAAPAQSQQSQANTDVLHTVRKSADAAFDFYLPRGKKEVELQGVEGEPVVLFQTERGEENGSYTVRRNGVLVVRR